MIALLCAPLPATIASAGACLDVDRTYCVTGTSNVIDWNWSVDSFSNLADASVLGLMLNDPATAIVDAMVTDMTNIGATAAILGLNPTCFVVTSCTQLSINGTIVPTITPISFNPDIVQIIPEPSSVTQLVAGCLALAGLARRRRQQDRSAARQEGLET